MFLCRLTLCTYTYQRPTEVQKQHISLFTLFGRDQTISFSSYLNLILIAFQPGEKYFVFLEGKINWQLKNYWVSQET